MNALEPFDSKKTLFLTSQEQLRSFGVEKLRNTSNKVSIKMCIKENNRNDLRANGEKEMGFKRQYARGHVPKM